MSERVLVKYDITIEWARGLSPSWDGWTIVVREGNWAYSSGPYSRLDKAINAVKDFLANDPQEYELKFEGK